MEPFGRPRLSRFATLLLLLVSLAPCRAQAQIVIARQGDVAPGTGGGTFSSFTPIPAINDRGHVAFQSILTGGTASDGVFLDPGSGVVAVAIAGDVAPDSGGGTFFSFGPPALNSQGELVFSAVVFDSSSADSSSIPRRRSLPSCSRDKRCPARGASATSPSRFRP